MFAIIGKLKKAIGVVAVHAVVELMDLGWKRLFPLALGNLVATAILVALGFVGR